MTDREKIIELLEDLSTQVMLMDVKLMDWTIPTDHLRDSLADYLIANSVRLETKEATSNENKRIEELEAQLAEREKVVIQLRKQWQDAEMHICTMCGHFDHKTYGNMICGNKTCGEICGYPFCAAKFTPWIPVSERLPEDDRQVLACTKKGKAFSAHYDHLWKSWSVSHTVNITHWMPLPEPPKEV